MVTKKFHEQTCPLVDNIINLSVTLVHITFLYSYHGNKCSHILRLIHSKALVHNTFVKSDHADPKLHTS